MGAGQEEERFEPLDAIRVVHEHEQETAGGPGESFGNERLAPVVERGVLTER